MRTQFHANPDRDERVMDTYEWFALMTSLASQINRTVAYVHKGCDNNRQGVGSIRECCQ